MDMVVSTVRQGRVVFVPLLAWLVTVLLAPPLWAQAVTGTLLGSVTDAEGLAIPGATVTITEVNTNIKTTAVTNENGNYVFASLRNGTYRVEAELTGFKKAIRDGVTVQVN